MLSATVHTTFRDVDAARWDALGSDPLSEHAVLRALEDAALPGVRLWAVRLSDERGRWVAAAPLARIPIDARRLTRGAFRRGISMVRRIRPRFLRTSLLVCGTPLSVGNPPARLCPGADAAGVTARLARVVEELADRERIPWRAFKEFDGDGAATAGPALEACGYVVAPSEPNARLDIRWTSFEGYRAALRSHYRRKIALAERALARAGITTDETAVAPAYDAAAHRLYEAVADRAPVQLERLTAPFFTLLGRSRPAGTSLLRFRREGRVVGWVAMLLADGVAYDLFHGIDDAVNEPACLYFNQVAAAVRWAIDRGARALYLGQSSETAKARFGAERVPLWMAVRHRDPGISALLRAGRRPLFPEPPAPVRHVFTHSTDVAGGTPCAT